MERQGILITIGLISDKRWKESFRGHCIIETNLLLKSQPSSTKLKDTSIVRENKRSKTTSGDWFGPSKS